MSKLLTRLAACFLAVFLPVCFTIAAPLEGLPSAESEFGKPSLSFHKSKDCAALIRKLPGEIVVQTEGGRTTRFLTFSDGRIREIITPEETARFLYAGPSDRQPAGVSIENGPTVYFPASSADKRDAFRASGKPAATLKQILDAGCKAPPSRGKYFQVLDFDDPDYWYGVAAGELGGPMGNYWGHKEPPPDPPPLPPCEQVVNTCLDMCDALTAFSGTVVCAIAHDTFGIVGTAACAAGFASYNFFCKAECRSPRKDCK